MLTIGLIIVFFCIGYVARRHIDNISGTVKWLNHYIVYVAMPSIIFLKVPALDFTTDMLIPAGFAWAWALIGGALILIISRILAFPRPLEGAALLLTILGNTSFLGYPMVQAFFDDAVLGYAIFYDQLGSFLMLSTAGLIVIAIYAPAGSGHSVTFSQIAKRVFSFPPFIALIIASTLPIEPVVNVTEDALVLFGKSLMPLALIVIGLQFQPQLLEDHKRPLLAAVSLKMMVAPLLAVGLFVLLSANGTAYSADNPVRIATIFEAAMPSMITPGILAIQAGLAPRFCATVLGYSTLFSFAWLPLIAYLI